ncbi:MAG: PPC domain-containing protein [Planctomycetes bacterium]|nr:PPC domain-containing protein [Planctomycetota bacterium]
MITTHHRIHLPFLLALATPLLAQRVAEVEPNNTVAQAQIITAGTQITANLQAGEQDWFTFTLAAAAEIHLQTSGNFAVNPSVNTAVLLYDATGATRLAWDDGARSSHSDVGCNLQPGTYTCLVVGATGTIAGDYGLDFLVYPAATIQTVESAEPNHSPMTGGTPTPITLGDAITGDLSSPTDVDWFTFAITGQSVVQAICYDDGGVPQLDNTRLSFYQETSPGVWAAFGTSSTLATSHRSFLLAHPTTLAAGNYAIEVSAGAAAAGTAPLNYTKTGAYGLRTRLIALPATNTVGEAPEPNNSTTTAAFFNVGDAALGNCSGQNEGDWYGFAVNGPTTLVAITADAPGSPTPITDTTIRLLDVFGNFITSASSGGASSHARLITTIPQAGLYFLEVQGGLFAATGDYILYTGSVDPMFVPASFRAEPPSTNACPGSNALRPALVVASGEVPQLGSTFVVRLHNTLPNAVAIPFFGFSRDFANGGLLPLPYDMTQNGAPGCFLRVDPLTSILLVTDGAGIGYFEALVPTFLGLRGLPLFTQSLQLDMPLNTAGFSMSNDARMLVGDRGY